jgi:hypothetical protein
MDRRPPRRPTGSTAVLFLLLLLLLIGGLGYWAYSSNGTAPNPATAGSPQSMPGAPPSS